MKKAKLTGWKNIMKNYFAPSTTPCADYGDFSLPSTLGMMTSLTRTVSKAACKGMSKAFGNNSVAYSIGNNMLNGSATISYAIPDTGDGYMQSIAIND